MTGAFHDVDKSISLVILKCLALAIKAKPTESRINSIIFVSQIVMVFTFFQSSMSSGIRITRLGKTYLVTV